MVSAAPAAAAAAALAWVGRREERASPGAAATVREFPGRQGGEGWWVGRSAGRRRRAGGSGNSGAPGSSRTEPPRLRLTIGSGRSALALIGAGTSGLSPGARWEMESTCLPHAQRHAGSWRRLPEQSRNSPANRLQEAAPLLQRTLGKRVWRSCSLLKRKRGDPQLLIFND